MDGAVTEHYHFILLKIWGWNGQELRFCVDCSLKRRTKRGLQKHPDTSGWGLNRKAGREAIAPSVFQNVRLEWHGQKRRCCVDGGLKRRTKRRLQKHPDTSGWGLNLKAGREAIAPSVPSFPSFSSNGDFRRPLSPSHARSPSCASLGGCSCRL